ncbi:MAG: DUF1273 family protein [Clostridia bacterium]|nr:DUF1273 family protein [Clostridia bacterium]
MEQPLKICCVTGHRPQGFPWEYTRDPADLYASYYQFVMEREVENLIKEGYNYFICGGACGVDMDFADAVLFLKERRYPHIQLEIAIPCPEQDKYWSETDKLFYKDILAQADKKVLVSEKPSRFCFHKRNQYMVDKSDFVLVFWNEKEKGGTYSTYKYAQKKGKKIKCHLLHRFPVFAEAERACQKRLLKMFKENRK